MCYTLAIMAIDEPDKHIPFRRRWSVRRFWPRSSPRYQHIPELARRLQVPEATIIRWLDERKLAACKLGYHPEPFINLDDLLRSGLLDSKAQRLLN